MRPTSNARPNRGAATRVRGGHLGLTFGTIAFLVGSMGCGAAPSTRAPSASSPASPPPAAAVTPAATLPSDVTLTVLGTNDLHGRIERAAIYAGFVDIVRRLRAADGGGLLVLDGGDLFQGTLESNGNEGAAVIAAYNAFGMTASAIGNHEFDFGPVGPAMIPRSAEDDPRGALKERLAEARFPFLNANLLVKATGERLELPNTAPGRVFEVAGVKVGVVGLATEETLTTTISANVSDLAMAPSADALLGAVREVRAAGAEIVIGIGHLGGKCAHTSDPRDLSSCKPDEEVFRLLRAIPKGSLDVFVGGHTHAMVAHFVEGTAVIESGAMGRAFGRVDLTFDRRARRLKDVRLYPPREFCPGEPAAPCAPGTYEGEPVTASPATLAAIRPFLDAAEAQRREPLGVEVRAPFPRSGSHETALGNLLADLMRAARPRVDFALINGGGIRAPLPAGDLSYGQLFEVFPFDNRFATVEVTAKQVGEFLLRNVNGSHAVVSVSGITAVFGCEGPAPVVTLRGQDGRRLRDGTRLTMLTSDFVALGGDDLVAGKPHTLEDGPPLREALIEVMKRRKQLSPDERRVFDPAHPRLTFPEKKRPVRCPVPPAPEAAPPSPASR